MGLIVPDAIEQLPRRPQSAPAMPCSTRSRAATQTRGLPLVDAEVGALLRVLATAVGATRILEIGTAIGYSGHLARRRAAAGRHAADDGDRARSGRAKRATNFARAGLADRVSVIVGDAQLKIAKVAGPFDLIFQDGDKPLYEPLLDRLVGLLRPGGLLVTDNVLWNGEVVPGLRRSRRTQTAEDTRAIAAYNERLAAHPRSDDRDRAAARRRGDFGKKTVKLEVQSQVEVVCSPAIASSNCIAVNRKDHDDHRRLAAGRDRRRRAARPSRAEADPRDARQRDRGAAGCRLQRPRPDRRLTANARRDRTS